MTTKTVDPFDKLSLKYQKWIIKIIGTDFEKPIYLVWLTDSTDKDEDKILTNERGRLIASYKVDKLLKYIIDSKADFFDKKATKTWAKKVWGLKIKKPSTTDFSKLQIKSKTLDNQSLEEIANFINLFTDLITTTLDKKLDKLRERKEIKTVWEYFFNYIFWPRFNDREKFKTFRFKKYKNNSMLQSTLQKMRNEFTNRIEILD
jgi:hypothetical protein